MEKGLVRHSYDNVIDRCARLSFFSAATVRDFVSDDIIARGKSLAFDDIITLSINTRRFAENCSIDLTSPGLRVRKWNFDISGD